MAEARDEEREVETTVEIDELEHSPSSVREDEKEQHGGELEAIVAIAELLEVALHTILCIRQVYPIEIFERRVKFGIPVFKCIAPSINEYISETIKAISEELVEDRIARVTISIHQSDTPLEKFIFSFYSATDGDSVPEADNVPLEAIRRQARGMLIKLNAIDAQLLPLEASDDLSFSVIMQLRQGSTFRISEDELRFGEAGKDESRKDNPESTLFQGSLQDPSLVHIIRTGRLSVYLHVQESEAKEHTETFGAE
ncbi:DNA-binding protein [Sanghuangporus baumii]|uniref:DNA-binding protein n=1 Tax=Sanghuangporus baumii TaxID=108892 RepID=A0A9Q5N2T7_SANBA|nr:DNA-binding protein [Sanghuangporus baumii]